MYMIRMFLALLVAAALSACGGGGGSPGATSAGGGPGSTPGTGTTTVATPTVTVLLRDASNNTVSSVTSSPAVYAQATVTSASGASAAGQVVTFTSDASLVKFVPQSGTALTDNNGVAVVQVIPASPTAAGAGVLTATATVAGAAATPGTVSFQVPASGTTNTAPTIALQLLNGGNSQTNSVSASGVTTARATLLDASGAAVPGKVVVFTADPKLLTMNPASGQVLTDSAGVATVQVTPASLSAAGASTMTASATVGSAAVKAAFDYQLSAANLALTSLNLGSGAVPAYGNRAVSVGVTVNGAAATNTPVQVTFSASCGSVTPAAVTTDGTGTASTTYKADNAACPGSNVTISASATGASPLSGTIAVASSLASNVQFVSAAPQMIYLAGSVGATQSQVSFKVVDASGNPLQNQQLQFSIVNSAPGVSLNSVGNTNAVTLTSDASGVASVAVFSGTVPTSLQVRATLVANPTVAATSNVLVVASGRPVQRSLSIATKDKSIEGWTVDGATTEVTVSMADRQGNPVPDGTQVNLTSGYGLLVPATCVTKDSSCTVTFRSQGTRPTAGRVAILAYVPGEEDFVDMNGNNVYDPGESFTDLGNAFRDEYTPVTNGVLDPGEFYVPRPGSVSCGGGVNGVANTCDGVWGAADVRVQGELIEASSTADNLAATNISTATGFTVKVADVNNNSMPTGSAISAEVLTLPAGSKCAVVRTLPTTVPNTVDPTYADVSLSGCLGGEVIGVTVTAPSGTQTLLRVNLP